MASCANLHVLKWMPPPASVTGTSGKTDTWNHQIYSPPPSQPWHHVNPIRYLPCCILKNIRYSVPASLIKKPTTTRTARDLWKFLVYIYWWAVFFIHVMFKHLWITFFAGIYTNILFVLNIYIIQYIHYIPHILGSIYIHYIKSECIWR